MPNRLLFEARLEHTLERAARAEEKAAILFLDLDGFKAINDAHGHADGDSVLQTVARRLEGLVRAEDTVARLGGDEFVIILEELRDRDHALDVARRILETLTESISVGARQHTVGASVGVAFYPDHADEKGELLRHADAAMYAAKDGGKGRVEIYSPDMVTGRSIH